MRIKGREKTALVGVVKRGLWEAVLSAEAPGMLWSSCGSREEPGARAIGIEGMERPKGLKHSEQGETIYLGNRAGGEGRGGSTRRISDLTGSTMGSCLGVLHKEGIE